MGHPEITGWEGEADPVREAEKEQERRQAEK